MTQLLGSCRACGVEYRSLTQAVGPRTDPARDTRAAKVAICVTCGEFSVMENGPLGLVLRAPTDAELAEIAEDPGVIRARASLQETWKCHGPPAP